MKIRDNKMNHMRGVAEYMYQNAGKYGVDNEEAYVVGLLHDIGYINDDAAKRNFTMFGTRGYGHEVYGAALLGKMGIKEEYRQAIMSHGTAPLNVNESIRNNPMLKLLWEADMSVNRYGNRVGFDGRLADIGKRYGYDSVAYETAKATVDYLKSHEKKSEKMLREYDKDRLTLDMLKVGSDISENGSICLVHDEPLTFEDNCINAEFETWFNVDEVFGTNINDTDNWINFYADYFPGLNEIAAYYTIDMPNGMETVEYDLLDCEKEFLLKIMEDEARAEGYKNLDDMWEHRDDRNMDSPEYER